MNEILWICGRYISPHDEGSVWDFQGVYSSEELAVEACVNDQYFVGRAVLNDSSTSESQVWPGAYYPLGSGEG